jgi:hypothetical protein
MAPEYAVLGQLSVKLDVYSLGVLILEIVTGRKNTDMFESAAGGESVILLSYVSCRNTVYLYCTCIHDPSRSKWLLSYYVLCF